MRYKLYFFLTVVVFAGSQLRAMPDPHDTLIFDGENEFVIPSGTSDDCGIEVTRVKGGATATKIIKEEITGCGGEKIVTGKYETGQIKVGDNLKFGDIIETGPDGEVVINLWEFGPIYIPPNTKFIINSEMCTDITVLMKIGSIWTWVKKELLGGKKFSTSSEMNSAVGVRGTRFSFEVKVEGADTIDITKVYEGKVEVSLKNKEMKDADDFAKKMEQLANDLQSGKITMEEFQTKAMEYQAQMEKQVSEMLPVTVEAGYKCTATKYSLKVEPIESDDVHWWEEGSFK